MEISVVLVNYKVPYYLNLALRSLEAAIRFFEFKYQEKYVRVISQQIGDAYRSPLIEVWVVDNDSKDEASAQIPIQFPWINWIQNETNEGFAKANNIALRKSHGKYFVLQNPDTVIAEDTLWLCWCQMELSPQVGGMGVRMIDGNGRFLLESKRGIPTPEAAFYKLSGLARLFPRHPRISAYHQGHLHPNENHRIPILAGAYMWVRRTVAEQIGLLDEGYFMYGEDIDWSYRIDLAGYHNFYFSGTTILHFKGESTSKDSLRYVRLFYGAMARFANQYYGSIRSGWFGILLQAGIIGRAFISILKRLSRWAFHPFLDFFAFLISMHSLTQLWENHIKPGNGGSYPMEFTVYVIPLYVSSWVVGLIYYGAYERPYRFANVLMGILAGSVGIAVVYGFLPMEWRFSRGLIVTGALVCAFFSLMLKGVIQSFLLGNRWFGDGEEATRLIGIGRNNGWEVVKNSFVKNRFWLGHLESKRNSEIMNSTDLIQGRSLGLDSTIDSMCIGSFNNIQDVLKIFPVGTLVYDLQNLCFKDVINVINVQGPEVKEHLFWIQEENILIGSGNVIHLKQKEFYWVDMLSKFQKIKHRASDLFWALAATILINFGFWKVNPSFRKENYLIEIWLGKRNWIGSEDFKYAPETNRPPVFSLEKCFLGPLEPQNPKTFESLVRLYYLKFSFRREFKLSIRLIRNVFV